MPSIIGIEYYREPISCGFLTDLLGFSYNEEGLYDKVTNKTYSKILPKLYHLKKNKLSEQNI